jgi:histidyl-tRNA synthetase
VKNEAGEEVVFGSVAGGGRYDDLVARFTGQQVPATGISIGVSRLLSALKNRSEASLPPLVVVLALGDVQSSFQMAAELRDAVKKKIIPFDVRFETYVGTKKFGDQLKYADKRGAAIAIIQGEDERAHKPPLVVLKDLSIGKSLSEGVETRERWLDATTERQIPKERSELVEGILNLLKEIKQQ